MEGSSDSQQSRKRVWTPEEDATLVAGLLQLVDEGWKADANSFKPGYTKALEKYIQLKIPNCDLKATPHIESRVKHIKKQYGAIKDMLGPSASGFGWDAVNKKIMVEREIYREWVKSHPTAAGLFGKSFPHFDSLDFVFGKDRTTGTHAESPATAAMAMYNEYFPQAEEDGEPVVNLNIDDINVESQIPEPTQGATPMDQSESDARETRGGKRGGKKTKDNDAIFESLAISMKTFGEFYAGTVDNIQQLTSCFLPEKETADRKTQVTPMLKEIEGLTTSQVVKAAILITNNNNLSDCFFSMDTPELKKEFVDYVLRNNGA